MSIAHLPAPTMVALTSPWVTPGSAERKALQSMPETAAMIPHVDRAHAGLLSAQGMSLAERVAPFTRVLTSTDFSYDSFWRVLHHGVSAAIQLALARGQEQRARELEQVYAEVLPHELKVVQWSYLDEIGEAKMLAARISPESKQILSGLTVDGTNLLDVVNELLTTAETLGRLMDQRADARQAEQVVAMADARSAWMRVITLVRNIVAMTRTTNPVLHDMLARIRDAEEQAELRGSSPAEPDIEPDAEPGAEPDAEPGAEPDVEPGTEPVV